MPDHSRAFALLPAHLPPSLEDWMVWADWLMVHDPDPWRDRRIHKRIVRSDPNNVGVDRLSMSKAYCPGAPPGVFAWADYMLTLAEDGWVHGPACAFWSGGDVLWRIQHWARSPGVWPAAVYAHPGIYRQVREGLHIATNSPVALAYGQSQAGAQ